MILGLDADRLHARASGLAADPDRGQRVAVAKGVALSDVVGDLEQLRAARRGRLPARPRRRRLRPGALLEHDEGAERSPDERPERQVGDREAVPRP